VLDAIHDHGPGWIVDLIENAIITDADTVAFDP